MLISFLSACEKQIPINSCPSFPEPGGKVADELEQACYPDSKCPETWKWIDRLYILRDQLKVDVRD